MVLMVMNIYPRLRCWVKLVIGDELSGGDISSGVKALVVTSRIDGDKYIVVIASS